MAKSKCFEVEHLDPKYAPHKFTVRAKSEAAVKKKISDPEHCIIKPCVKSNLPG